MNILVTGGAGFIGSNFITYMLRRYEHKVINLDLLTYAGNTENNKSAEDNPNYTFIHGDICDNELIGGIFAEHKIDAVVNFAAETHVDNSISCSRVFTRTNILGTQTLMDTARTFWGTDGVYTDGVRFLQVSTDEVYGELGPEGFFKETDPLCPSSPYSASKAGADMLALAYRRTYGFPVIITRCSNNYGPYQHPEKLIPLMISNAMQNKSLPVYGDGRNVRDWLYVEDHCSAIDAALQKGEPGEVYNVGGRNEWENIELVRLILKTLGKSEELITFVQDRPGHDRRYAICGDKIRARLGWKPQYGFDEGIAKTIQWYVDNRDWLAKVLNK